MRASYFHQPMVVDLLRVQALFFLANPFIALGHALLVRRLEFKRQSRIDLVAAVGQRRRRRSPALMPASACGPWSRRRRRSGIARAAAMSSPRGSGRSGRASASRAPARCFATARRWSRCRPAGSSQSQADVFIAGRLARSAPARPLHHRLVPDPDPRRQVRAAAERGRLRRLFADSGPARRDPDRVPQIGAADHARRSAFLFRAGGDGRAVRADLPRAEVDRDGARWCRCSPWRCRW